MKHLIVAASALFIASPALAADLSIPYTPAPVVPVAMPASDWSGFYAGIHAGYGWGTTDIEGADFDASGWLAGGQIGFRQQMDVFVLGLQTDLSVANLSTDEDLIAGGTADWYGSTTIRAGVAATDAVLVYALGGIAYAGVTATDGVEDISNTHLGWTAGVGAEVALTDNVSVFGEYAYSSLGSQTYEFASGDTDVSFDTHIVKAGLNFSF
ncbi:outer membrane immunogenic protein [Devosia enhydra]|uniref:Outer membrane immunogenic protein n=1 Tax=Devosia enhydra TaxID=665118 RepID=A0A1K2I0N7_9HYPH|nr:outer membrane protein [Devosia enhydra]SFZ85839.1 outer membrane immunogenic protein [Devosia enhydra]